MNNQSGKTGKRFPEKAACALICAGTIALSVLFVLLPDRGFSDNENRTLAARPALSVSGVIDGSFQEAFETYLADQFAGRDVLFALSVRAQRLLGKQEIGGVFLCGDRLIDVYEEPVHTDKFVAAVRRLYENLEDARLTVVLVPTAVDLEQDVLPRGAAARMPVTQEETLRELRGALEELAAETPADNRLVLPDVQRALRDAHNAAAQRGAADDGLFYRTDHHWTTKGARCALEAIAPALGLTGGLPGEEALTTVSENFYGTTWSKICDRSIKPDAIEIYENPAWSGSLRVSSSDTDMVTDTPYNRAYLEKRDQYSLFLDNLHPLVVIENEKADGDASLAVIKDSYANCLIPYLIDHYRTIYVFDPRYYRGGISDFVNEHPEIRDVLILYNLQTMDNDRGIGAIS